MPIQLGTKYCIQTTLAERDNQNLIMLWGRKKGEWFYSDQGCLKVMGVWQRVCYRLSTSYRQRVNHAVSQTIGHLTSRMSHNALQCDLKEEFLVDFFFTKISHLSRSVYKREMNNHALETLAHWLQRREDAAANFKRGEPHSSPAIPTQAYSPIYKSAQLWARLGNFELLDGCTGSYRILHGRVFASGNQIAPEQALGIFKPADEDFLTKGNPQKGYGWQAFLINRLFRPFRGSLPDCMAGQACVAEEANKRVEFFIRRAVQDYLRDNTVDAKTTKLLENLQLLPDTRMGYLTLGNKPLKKGSFQLWVQEPHQEASRFLGVKIDCKQLFCHAKPTLQQLKQKLPPELFDLLVIFDYVTGNLDRHGENWFTIHEEGAQATGIRLIDGGWSLAPNHPTCWDRADLRYQYAWRNLALADEPFTDLGNYVIQSLYTHQARIKETVQQIYDEHLPEEGAKTQNRVDRMGERLKVLRHFPAKATKRQLSHVNTHDAIKRMLKRADQRSAAHRSLRMIL